MKEGQKNPAAVALGSISTAKKAAAAKKNGRLGGRPKKALYKCRISDFSANACGGCGKIHERILSADEIINIAIEEAGRHGVDLETVAGIEWDAEREEYRRGWKEGEQLQAALDYLRHDGAVFEVELA